MDQDGSGWSRPARRGAQVEAALISSSKAHLFVKGLLVPNLKTLLPKVSWQVGWGGKIHKVTLKVHWYNAPYLHCQSESIATPAGVCDE